MLVYQSRSGAPGQPWLEPDILDYLREVKGKNLASAVVIAPISFISDHMEVLYDLDIEARHLCDSLALPMARAKTVGVHPKFIAMIRELILERTDGSERRALGSLRSATGRLRRRIAAPRRNARAAASQRTEVSWCFECLLSRDLHVSVLVVGGFRTAFDEPHRIQDGLHYRFVSNRSIQHRRDKAIASANRH